MGTSVRVVQPMMEETDTTWLPGLPTAPPVVGPMAADLPAVELAMKSILDSCPRQIDFVVIGLPWREEKVQSIRNRACRQGEQDRRLTFTIMQCDGTV